MSICDSLGEFADGEINPDVAAAFRAHLPECQTCRDELAKTMHLLGRLSSLSLLLATKTFVAKEYPDHWWRWSWLWMRWEVHAYADYSFRTGKYLYGIESEDGP